ncbi:MAG: nuclear transport factor 2 family protein [Planctomycetota bacterium]
MAKLQRVLLFAALAAVAWFGGRAVVRALASDETRIGWLLQGEAASFNGAAMLSVLGSFAPDYRETTVGIDRQALRAALLWAFQNRRDRATGRFLYRVELPAEELQVTVDGDRARAAFALRLFEGLDAAAVLRWELAVEAELERGQDGWRVARSRHETVTGERPR